jgi:hypothetical protein
VIKIDEKDPSVIALRAAESKLQQLLSDRAAKESELSVATQKYMAARKSIQHSKLEAEAEQLLGGQQPGQTETQVESADLERIQHQIDVLNIAIDRQQQTVDVLRGKFSLAVCNANRARYVEIERRIARAVQELAQANEDEARFIEELRDAGCSSVSFRPMRINEVGLASDSQSRAANHRKELQQFLPEAAA